MNRRGDYLDLHFGGRSGVLHIETPIISDVLDNLTGFKFVGERKMIVGHRNVTFRVYFVEDLAQAYYYIHRLLKFAPRF